MSTQTVRRFITLISSVAMVLTAVGAGAQQSSAKRVVVTVGDQTFKPVKGLTASDFALREDGEDREITGAAAATDAPFIVVTVDTTKDRNFERNIQDVRNSIATFVKGIHAANPDAMIALMTHAGAAVKQVDFTKDAAKLEKAIQRLFYEEADSVLLEALVDASKDLQKKDAIRKLIVAFSIDAGREGSQTRPADVANAVRNAGATIWSVTLKDKTETNANRDNMLNGLGGVTGGGRMTVLTGSAIEGKFKELADLLSSQYIVSYNRPAGGKAPQQVQVMVKKEGVLVAAPQWPPK